jgi:hypothetical protein
MGSLVVSDALMHYGLPVIRLNRVVGGRHYDSGEIPDIVRKLYRFVEDFNDFVSAAIEPGWRNTPGTDEMSDGDKRERVAGSDLVDVKVVSFVPSGEAGDVGLKHEGKWGSSISAERQSPPTGGVESPLQKG